MLKVHSVKCQIKAAFDLFGKRKLQTGRGWIHAWPRDSYLVAAAANRVSTTSKAQNWTVVVVWRDMEMLTINAKAECAEMCTHLI